NPYTIATIRKISINGTRYPIKKPAILPTLMAGEISSTALRMEMAEVAPKDRMITMKISVTINNERASKTGKGLPDRVLKTVLTAVSSDEKSWNDSSPYSINVNVPR